MNFIRQTQKFHRLDASATRFSIDASPEDCALPLSCTVQCLFSRGDAQALAHASQLGFNDQLHSALPSRGRFLLPSWKLCMQRFWETHMATFGLIEYQDAAPEVRAVYDDIMATRKIDWISNFWKAIAHDPALLKRTWESLKQIMAPGALDPLTKEMIYIAVSVTNNCNYCIASHTASAFGKGMTDAMFKELQAIIGMANETNKLVTGYQVEADQRFQPPLPR
jgi:AhpD family alkylhydroperoxidase